MFLVFWFKLIPLVCLNFLPYWLVVVMFPLNPSLVLFTSTMFIIPLFPSGLYLADGLVISSMFLIAFDGICCSSCSVGMFVGFPSINTRTFVFPLKDSVPVCGSTATDWILSKTSAAAAPIEVKSLPTLMTILSTFWVTVEVSDLRTIVFSASTFSSKDMFFSRIESLLLKTMDCV